MTCEGTVVTRLRLQGVLVVVVAAPKARSLPTTMAIFPARYRHAFKQQGSRATRTCEEAQHAAGVGTAASQILAHPARRAWPTFGGAIDVSETAWRAAVRDTCEEIQEITPDQAGIAGQCVWQCPQRCGWAYTTSVVRVLLYPGGSLPRARVADGHSAWETAELAWVPVSQVQSADRDLHPSFADAWPPLPQVIFSAVPMWNPPARLGRVPVQTLTTRRVTRHAISAMGGNPRGTVGHTMQRRTG